MHQILSYVIQFYKQGKYVHSVEKEVERIITHLIFGSFCMID
jgi:hypothetical protein